MTAVVLLGAGASFGSVDAIPHTPPLGDKLFDDLQRAGGVAAQLPPDLREEFRCGNFEKGMAAYYKFSRGNVGRFQRELALYLAWFWPGPNNVYVRMIRELGVSQVIYSSLNYDLLFELSARVLGLQSLYGTQKRDRCARILKLHGSVNFWPDEALVRMSSCNFGENSGPDIQAPIKPLNQWHTIYRCLTEDSMAPAIAMYAEGKEVKTSPEEVNQQQEMWISSVNSAHKVFVVGVRVHPPDEHIWGTLGRCEADLTYYGFPSDEEAFRKWESESGKKNVCFVKKDFSTCILDIKNRLR